ISMPWVDNVKGVLEAWYPGIGGAQALAAIPFGDVNPSARLPVTFAKTDADLPHPQVPGIDLKAANRPPPFDVNYTEGLKVGYKWFEAEHKQPLFPFGYGLSYTTFAYSALKADSNTVSFSVKNTGRRAGTEVAQVYVMLPSAAGEPFKRLAAWERVPLKAGESKTVTLPLDPLYLSGSERESDGTAIFTQLSSPAEPRGTDVGHRHPLGRGHRGRDWFGRDAEGAGLRLNWAGHGERLDEGVGISGIPGLSAGDRRRAQAAQVVDQAQTGESQHDRCGLRKTGAQDARGV